MSYQYVIRVKTVTVSDCTLLLHDKPVLDGDNSHQGAPDKAEKATRLKMGSSGTRIRNSFYSPRERIQLGCMSTDDNCREHCANQCLSDAARTLSTLKAAICLDGQCTSTETSNLLSECTTEDSFSHNGKSEITFNASTNFGGLETLARAIADQNTEGDVENFKHDTIPASENFSNQCTNQKGVDFIADYSANTSEALSLSDTFINDNSQEGELSGIYQQDGKDCSDSVKSFISMDGNKGVAEAENSFQHKELGLELGMVQKVSDLQGPLHSRPSHYSDVPIVEVEVKVCDTCGDTGREDLLALCSKCSDGAEHTYCMRIKLEKVPEGNWMCEDCTQKEKSDKQMQDEMNEIARISRGSSLSGRRNSFRIRNESAGRGMKSLALDVKPANERKTEREKIAAKPKYSNKRPASNSETSSVLKRRVIEVNSSSNSLMKSRPCRKVVVNSSSNSVRACSPCRKVVAKSASGLPGVSSFHGKMGVKSTSSSPKACTPCKNVVLARHSSLENFEVGMTKPDTCMCSLTEQSCKDVCKDEHKHVVSLHGRPKPRRLPVMQGSLTKSNSVSSLEPATKVKLADQGVPQKQKFRTSISFDGKFDHSGSNSLSKTSEKTSSASKDPKSRSSGNRQPTMEVVRSNQDLSNSSKAHLSYKGSAHPVGHAGTSCVHKLAALSTNVTKIPSVSKISDRSKEAMLIMNGSDDSERAFEAGLKKRCDPDNQLLTDRSLVRVNGVVKGQERVAANVFKELNASEAAPTEKDESGKRHKSPSQSKPSHSGSMNNHALSNTTGPLADGPGESQGSSLVISDGGPNISGLHNSPVLESISCAISAYPMRDYNWKGGFEIRGNDRVPKLCYGLQAHLSSSASPKVFEAVEKFQRTLHLEAVSHLSGWPKYVDTFPTDYNIGIYIFAQSCKSFETQYKPLVDSMMKNDVALRGYVDGIEVLISASNILPEGSRQWNSLSYLWAVFRRTRVEAPRKYVVPDLNELPADEDMEDISESLKDYDAVQTNMDGHQT